MNYYICLPFKLYQGFCLFYFHTLSPNRAFSLAWSIAIHIYYEKNKRLHQHSRCDVMSKALQHWRIQGQRGAPERPVPPPYSSGTTSRGSQLLKGALTLKFFFYKRLFKLIILSHLRCTYEVRDLFQHLRANFEKSYSRSTEKLFLVSTGYFSSMYPYIL